MELNQIIEYIESPDKVLDVGLMEEVIDYTTFWIHTMELEIADLDFTLDLKLADLVEKHGTVAKAQILLRLTDEFRDRKNKELTLKSIKSYRQNIRRKRDRMLPR